MKIPDPIKSFIYKCDLFSVNVGFRFNQERQYSSITGGIFSILMISLFIGIFTNTCINTWNKQYIISIDNRKVYQDPSYLMLSREKYFFFTMGLTGIDMNSGIRYFDVTLTYNTYVKNKKIKNKKTLVPCRRQVWESFNDTGLLNSFDSLGLSKWLCPPQDDKFQISGKFTSSEFKFLKIGVQACNNNTDPTRRCATSAQLSDYLLKNELFTLNYYFINTIINPDQKQFIRYYFEDKNYFPFTLTQGLTANLYVSTYEVTTDQSLLPVEDIKSSKGGIVSQNAQIFPYYVTGTQYLKLYLRKSSQQLLIQRSFKKIDDTLSYIGGLFSSLLTFLILVKFYNELCYQLQIAKNIYRYDQNNTVDSIGFHFLNYIIYLLYFFLKLINCEPKWQQMQKYDKSLNEIRKQMDVRLIFKKILFVEKLANALLMPEHITALHLQDKITLSQAQQIRKNYNLSQLLKKQIQSRQKNPLSSRLGTQNNQQNQNTSKCFKIKDKSLQMFDLSQKDNKLQDMMNDKIVEQDRQKEENCKQLKNVKIKTQKVLTNSLSSISDQQQHKNKIYGKLMKTITFLTQRQQQKNSLNVKILNEISPQIKQMLELQKSSLQQKEMVRAPSSNQNTDLQIVFKQKQKQQKQKQPWKQLKRQKTIKYKRSQKQQQLKAINDIIVVQDFESPFQQP